MEFMSEDLKAPSITLEEMVDAKPTYITDIKFKKNVFKIMSDLDGWCSNHKASVLIDLIYIVRPKVVVEIGVFGGKSLFPIAIALKEIGKGNVIGIDPWNSAESALGLDGENKNYWSRLDHDRIYRDLLLKIEKYGLIGNITLIRETSAKAAPIADIDILHIDGNHSEISSMIDVYKWVPLVKSGGLIIFNDSNWLSTRKAADWLDRTCTKFAEFNNDNAWTIWVKS